MVRRAPPIVSVLVALLLAPWLIDASGRTLAADQGPAATQQTPFRASVDTVTVDVVVLDDAGQPVRDLTADDFEILENGRPQAVDTFAFIDVERAATSGPTTSGRIASMADQRREAAREETRLIAIFLDDYHVRLGNSLRVREQVAAFVRSLGPTEMVAVTYPLSSVAGLTFSRDHQATAGAVMAFEGRKYDYRPRNAYEDRYQLMPPREQERMRNDVTMAGLRALSSYLGTLRDGRKTVLFVSEGLTAGLPEGVRVSTGFGVPFEMDDPRVSESQAFFDTASLDNLLRDVYASAARANTAIYTLDPRGLAASEFSIEDSVELTDDRRALQDSTVTLRAMADETNGRAMVNQNDPRAALDQMLVDSSGYYLLGYVSTESPRDGRFQPIEVRVNRRDVDVRARKGYWAPTREDAERATAPSKPPPPADVRAAIDAVDTLTAGAASGSRALDVTVGVLPQTDGQVALTLAWQLASGAAVDADRLGQVTAVAYGAGNTELFRGEVPRVETLGAPAGLTTFLSPPGVTLVRLTAESSSGRRLDGSEVTLDVPDFTRPSLLVSDPVVYRGRTARDLQVVRAAERPLPAVARTFSRTERLLIVFAARAPGGLPPDVALRLLNRDGEAIAELPDPTDASGRYEAEVVLGVVPPGQYVIEVAAQADGETVRRLVAIRVTG